jgi:hypothetical protein
MLHNVLPMCEPANAGWRSPRPEWATAHNVLLDEVGSYSCINTKPTWINGIFTTPFKVTLTYCFHEKSWVFHRGTTHIS